MLNTRIADGLDLTAFGHTGLKLMAMETLETEEGKYSSKTVQMSHIL